MRYKIWVWLLLDFSGTAFSQNIDSLKTIVANSKRPTQIGSVMVGGNFNLNYSSNSQQIGNNSSFAKWNDLSYNVYGQLGFFTASFMVIGGQFYLSKGEENSYVGSNNSTVARNDGTSYGIGPFLRPYFFLNNKLPLFLHADFTVGIRIDRSLNFSETRISCGPGIAYFFTPNVSFEFILLYRYISNSYDSGSNNLVYTFSNNFNPTLGFQIYFHKK